MNQKSHLQVRGGIWNGWMYLDHQSDSKRAITIDAARRIDLLKLAERLGQREPAAAYLVDAPFEEGAQQRRKYSGRFNLRFSPQLHAAVTMRAAADGKSLNQWVADMLDESVHAF